MKRPTFRLTLSRWHEWLIYTTAGLLFITGIAWLLLGRFGKVEGEFGPEPSPALPWLLMMHGVATYAFSIVAAMLVPVHMRLGWNTGRNRRSGLLLVGLSLFLVLSGLGLYYSTAEDFRSVESLSHWIIGIALPLVIIIHFVRGKGSRPRSSRSLGAADDPELPPS